MNIAVLGVMALVFGGTLDPSWDPSCPSTVSMSAAALLARSNVKPAGSPLLKNASRGSMIRFKNRQSGKSIRVRLISPERDNSRRNFAVDEDGHLVTLNPEEIEPGSLEVATTRPPPNYAENLNNEMGDLQMNLRIELGGDSDKRSALTGPPVQRLFESMLEGETRSGYETLLRISGEPEQVASAFKKGAFLVSTLQKHYGRWEEQPIHGPYGAANEVLTKVQLINALKKNGPKVDAIADAVPVIKTIWGKYPALRAHIEREIRGPSTIEEQYLMLRPVLLQGLSE